MKQLDPENERLLVAAQGYLDLGLPLDANNEIESMNAEVRHLPEVLEVRVGIYRKLEKWELMQTVAKSLALHDPDEPQFTIWWAYATRRADSLDAARLILVNAVERLPEVPIFLFNLACYESQLGDIERAKKHLQHAIELRGGLRRAALEDSDLRPVVGCAVRAFPACLLLPQRLHESHANHSIAPPYPVIDHELLPLD